MTELHRPGSAYFAKRSDLGFPVDDIDREIIGLLRRDARLSDATLAAKIGVARGTISHRVRRLEEKNVIVGYTLQLRPDAEPPHIRAWMAIQVDGNRTNEVIAGLLGEPNVIALHDTNGRWDLMAELRAASPNDLSAVLERVRLLKAIRHTETSILLKTFR